MSVGAVDVRLGGDVFERAITLVVVEDILRARQSARAAHHGNSLPHTVRTLPRCGSGGQIKVHVVGYHQVEFAVTVVIDKGAARAPGFSRTHNPSFLGNLGEDAAFVVIQAVLSVISNVQIFPAVVVIVSLSLIHI